MYRVAIFAILSVTLAQAQFIPGVYLGEIKTIEHNTKGSVYALDEKTIIVRRFQYDGQAPGTIDSIEIVITILSCFSE
jgi:hypothetical protein